MKQHLAAIRMLLDWLVLGQVIPMNPASSVRGPKHLVKRRKTPVLSADQARALIDSINVTSIAGLRDRALIGVMVHTFARISAAASKRVEDYFPRPGSAGGSGSTRKAASSTMFRRTTTPKPTWTRASKPPASSAIRRARWSGRSAAI